MKLMLILNTENRISQIRPFPYDEEKGETLILYDLPDNFDVVEQINYKIIDGKLIHDPLPEPEIEEMEAGASLEERLNEQLQIFETRLTALQLENQELRQVIDNSQLQLANAGTVRKE